MRKSLRTRGIRAVVMWALQRPWLVELGRRIGLVNQLTADELLRGLNHLHYARWSIVHRFPRPSGAAAETSPYTLLLFTSYFDFGWRRYLGTFIETTGDGLGGLWGDAPSWRYPRDGYRAFENFVVDQQVAHAHLYSAFPHLACNDVRSLLRLEREMDSAAIDEEVLQRLNLVGGDQQRRARRRALLRRLQHCLGTIPDPAEPDVGVDRTSGDPIGDSDVGHSNQTSSITCLLPFDPTRGDELLDQLGRLSFGPHSPFATVSGTHFARLAVIDSSYFEPRSVPSLNNGYLLLSAEVDGSRSSWVNRLREVTALEPIWDCCHGYQGPESLASLLDECRIKPSLEHIDYPSATVLAISRAASRVGSAIDQLLAESTSGGQARP